VEFGVRAKLRGGLAVAFRALAPVAEAMGHQLQFRGMLELRECLSVGRNPDAAEAMFTQAMALGPGNQWPVRGARPDAKLLVMHWIQCCGAEPIERPLPDADPFAVITKRSTKLAPLSPKIAYRAGAGLRLVMGDHFVEAYPFNLETAVNCADYGLYLAHFPVRSIAQIRKKIINGPKAYDAAVGLDIHGGHWRARWQSYQQPGVSILCRLLE
jgi:hypothetical protein